MKGISFEWDFLLLLISLSMRATKFSLTVTLPLIYSQSDSEYDCSGTTSLEL